MENHKVSKHAPGDPEQRVRDVKDYDKAARVDDWPEVLERRLK